MRREERRRVADGVPGCTEWCSTCRAVAEVGQRGPYAIEQLQQLVIEPARPERDPDVAAAEATRDAARAVFDTVAESWKAALAAKTRAGLYSETDPAERRRLDEHEADLRERRDALWARVVAANDEIRAAQARAQQREAAATA
jgi:hypothetical protein